MTLTRHLYKVEEVRAALLYCIRCRRIEEANYWLTELEESLYGGEARRLLFVAWFLNVGLKRVAWLAEWAERSTSREGRQRLCWQLIRCTERDSSLWWLLCAAPTTDAITSSHLLGLWRSKCVEPEPTIWEWIVESSYPDAVEPCLEALQVDMKGYSKLAILTAICLTHAKLSKKTWLSLSNQEPVGLQSNGLTETNLRKKRLYTIPFSCLYGMTWRGRGGDSTEELYTLSWNDLLLSPIWRQLGKSAFDGSGWKGDDERETFFDTHFPWTKCDIPDEWSKKDQEKSHGTGVSCEHGAPLLRWWNSWIAPEHSWIWGKPVWRVLEWVRSQRADVGASVLDRILQLYSELGPKSYKRPVKEFILESSKN
jgi:hypothetical protein